MSDAKTQPDGRDHAMTIQAQKHALRQRLIAKRRAMGEVRRREASQAIVDRLRRDVAYQEAETLFVFMPMPEEVEIEALFADAERARKRLCFPVVLPRGAMDAYAPSSIVTMKPDRYGILAPDPQVDTRYSPERLDLIIVPMLTFDEDGYRLGYGGGYYDRYLERVAPHTTVMGVCFDVLAVPAVPHDTFDHRLSVIVTDRARRTFPHD